MLKRTFKIPREGFYVDTLAQWIRATFLNPYLSLVGYIIVKIWLYFLGKSNEGTSAPVLEQVVHILLYLTIIGSALSLNETLNTGCLNNWVKDPTWDWAEEVVVVTGGSSGIGASIAHQLWSRNPRTTVIIIDYSPLTFTPPPNAQLHYFQCDLSDSAALKETCAKIKKIASPTVLVNNAGIARGVTVLEGSYHDVEITFRTNIIAPFLLAKEFLPHMVERNHGHIIGVSSLSSIISPARIADYAATKAGILTLSEVSTVMSGVRWLCYRADLLLQTLRQELRFVHKANLVRVSTAVLGFIQTPMFRGKTNQSHFISPLIHVDTVGEAVVDALYKAESKTIWLPGISKLVASLVSSCSSRIA